MKKKVFGAALLAVLFLGAFLVPTAAFAGPTTWALDWQALTTWALDSQFLMEV